MKNRITLVAASAVAAALTLVNVTGCAVTSKQETVGAYVDDTGITTRVKAKFAEDKTVSAMGIGVETMKGTVQLTGFAKTPAEKTMAEKLARETSGVVSVKNDIVVR